MARNPVESYYHTFESLSGYRLLGGVKHFGYFPKGQENLPTRTAQELMDDQLAAALSLKPGSRVLDAGCGEGGVAFYLAKHFGLNVVGVDILDFNIRRANRAGRLDNRTGSVSFRVADYAHTGLETASFDGLYTMETLVHAPDYGRALDEFKRVLKPGGKVAMFEYSLSPDMPPRAAKAFAKVNELAAMPAFNEFTHGVLERGLSDHGFVDVQSQDITERMLPLLYRFERRARLPYRIAETLHLQDHVVNAMSSVVMTKYLKDWRYNVITAHLPNERTSST
jgi:sterol 24-C-methyltransferase